MVSRFRVPSIEAYLLTLTLALSRWPRFLVPSVEAYAAWPPAARARIGAVLAATGEHLPDLHPRERLSLYGPPGREGSEPGRKGSAQPGVCHYHPHVQGTEETAVPGTQGRGPQADFWARDGMWYL